MALEDIYTELIGEHSRNPENKHHLAHATCALKGHNPSCGDEITLELQIENGVVKDASFTGVGCAISQASTDIMIDLIRLLRPRYIEVWGKFLPRGGLSIDPFCNYGILGTEWKDFARYRLLHHDLNPERIDNR